MPLLLGKSKAVFLVRAIDDSVLLRFGEEAFWTLMSCCPSVRRVVLANMGQRLQMYQVEALHREKLVSLGTLAAGLMHELHNPGAAAKRAASQLRENLMRLQELSLRFSEQPKTPEQIECVHGLLEHTMRGCHAKALSSVEQADAERGHVGMAAGGRRRERLQDRAGAGGDRFRPAGTGLRARVSSSRRLFPTR